MTRERKEDDVRCGVFVFRCATVKQIHVVLAALVLSLPLATATEIPVAHPPAICKIEAVPTGSNEILVRWDGGTPPFVVLRGDAEDFTLARDVDVLAAGIGVRHYRDHIETGRKYWYLVADQHSPPRIFRNKPSDPYEGDLVTIHGIGFARECKANRLILGGHFDAAPVKSCAASTITFRVPRPALSGELEVMTENGVGGFESVFDDCEGIPRGPVTWTTPSTRETR